MQFTHLHVHTQYSLLEGAIRIKALIEALKSIEQNACAITDHGNMFGAVEFSQKLSEAELKPIVGLGAFVVEGALSDLPSHAYSIQAPPIQLLCQNRKGYQNLCYLSSLSYTEGKRGKLPCMDQQMLEQRNAGLIALSGGYEGAVSQYLLQGSLEKARSLASWYRDVFEGRYYLELQNTGIEAQHEVNMQLVALAEELNIPLVGTNNCFYLQPEEAESQHILRLMGEQRRVTDSDAPEMQGSQCYLKDSEAMRAALASYPESAFSNTQQIAEQCDLLLKGQSYHLPQFEVPSTHTLNFWFREEAQKGLDAHLQRLFKSYTSEETEDLPTFEEFCKPYQERLEYELQVIIDMDFPGYFLIVADFIQWAKKNGVSVGPGRGSGAGSLVAYSLLITDVDPLYYGLLFERFLNPDRISMPDFDIDFDVKGRDRVIEYVRKHYGEEQVCQISTFGSLKAKAVVRGVARVLNFPYSEANKIAKLIPNELNITLNSALEQEQALKHMLLEGNESEQKLIQLSLKLEGLSTHLGTHAAGVIIMDQDIRSVMPVCTGKNNSIQSMYSMKDAENQGAVKFDFLGLLNLSTIDETLKLIQKSVALETPLEMDNIPMDDKETFKLFCSGETTGVFQLESSGMKKLLVKMRPSLFEDIVAILALYRPGPLKSGMVDDFVDCKHGKTVVYLHPLLEDILCETYGVLVYQEQIMQAVQVLAGFSLGQADLLRRAIGKKIPEILAEQRGKFVEGCLQNTKFVDQCPHVSKSGRKQTPTPEEQLKTAEAKAGEIFDLIDFFSGYGFNKSHTVAYGFITYRTAYLKAHYPVQFMAALLNCGMGDPDKIVHFIGDCKALEITVLPPDINFSEKEFSVTPLDDTQKLNSKYEFAVRFGLSAVKNVGGNAVDAILEVRKNNNGKIQDFMEFLKSADLGKLNKRMLETLVQCGAFDSLNPHRAQLLAVIEEAVHLALEFQKVQSESQHSLFDLMDTAELKSTETKLIFPECREWSMKEKLKKEKETLGFYVSGHPLDQYQSELKQLTISTSELQENQYSERDSVTLAGVIIEKTIRLTRNSEKFAIVKIEDLQGSLEFPVYPKVYNECAELLEMDEPLMIHGRVNFRDEDVSIIAESVRLLSTVREEYAQEMEIELSEPYTCEAKLNTLRGILYKSPGKCPVRFKIHVNSKSTVSIKTNEQVTLSLHMLEEMTEALEHQKMNFTYKEESLRHK